MNLKEPDVVLTNSEIQKLGLPGSVVTSESVTRKRKISDPKKHIQINEIITNAYKDDQKIQSASAHLLPKYRKH